MTYKKMGLISQFTLDMIKKRHPELVSGSDNDEIPKQVRNDIMTVFSRISGVNCDINPQIRLNM